MKTLSRKRQMGPHGATRRKKKKKKKRKGFKKKRDGDETGTG